ncbi:MAG: polysaccharide biosynthesis/export family protein [Candidatus Scalinduaceae bacterium]
MMSCRYFSKVFLLILSVLFINSCSSFHNSVKEVPFKVAKEGQDIISARIKRPNEYIIASGDTINISVHNHPELTQNKITIPPSGKITYPFIGNLQAGGLSIFQLRDKIKSELTKGYIPNPEVSVNIDNMISRKVFVLGEVKNPKMLYIKGEMDAIEAISQTGGFARTAGKSVVFLIRHLEDNKRIMDVLDLKGFFKSKDFAQNVTLQRGDILYVPPSRMASVSQFMSHISSIIAPISPNFFDAVVLTPNVLDVFNVGGREGPGAGIPIVQSVGGD